MRYLSLPEVLDLHERIIATSGGTRGIRDLRLLESAVNQPRSTFNQSDLYPDVASKAAALCYSIINNEESRVEAFWISQTGFSLDSEIISH